MSLSGGFESETLQTAKCL